jgi:hypothetical protein
LRGFELGVWGSFPGEVYVYPGTSTVIKEAFSPIEHYVYPGSETPLTAECPQQSGRIVTLPWLYEDLVVNLIWLQSPYIVQGRHVPAFNDVDGQIIGAYAAEFSCTAVGKWNPPEDCAFPAYPSTLVPTPRVVHKTDLKVMVKVYR